MRGIIDSVYRSIENKNWYVALFVCLTLPDICGRTEKPNSGSVQRYTDWFDKYMHDYKGYLSGNDCYALRCALLHEGRDSIKEQDKQDVLDYFIFLTAGPHLNLVRDCYFNGVKKSFLQLNVGRFCKDICVAVENWLIDINQDQEIQKRLEETLKIREPGFVHHGIKFG